MMIRKLLLAFGIATFARVASGCNTVRGVGKDAVSVVKAIR